MRRPTPQPRMAALILVCTLLISFHGPASASDNEEIEARVEALGPQGGHVDDLGLDVHVGAGFPGVDPSLGVPAPDLLLRRGIRLDVSAQLEVESVDRVGRVGAGSIAQQAFPVGKRVSP